MDIMTKTCSSCSGLGYTDMNYEVVSEDNDTTTLLAKKSICECCDGKGYTEHALFSIDEAKAILKHCGLTTEN